MNSPNPYFYNVTRTLTLHDHKKKLQNDWNSLGFINILKYWMIMKFTKPLFLLSDSNFDSPCSPRNHWFSLLKWTFFSHWLAIASGRICWTTTVRRNFGQLSPQPPKISRHWSVVSCVRCWCWVLGLDSRLGHLRCSPPTSDQIPENPSTFATYSRPASSSKVIPRHLQALQDAR